MPESIQPSPECVDAVIRYMWRGVEIEIPGALAYVLLERGRGAPIFDALVGAVKVTPDMQVRAVVALSMAVGVALGAAAQREVTAQGNREQSQGVTT